jgi:hypothetical protein
VDGPRDGRPLGILFRDCQISGHIAVDARMNRAALRNVGQAEFDEAIPLDRRPPRLDAHGVDFVIYVTFYNQTLESGLSISLASGIAQSRRTLRKSEGCIRKPLS